MSVLLASGPYPSEDYQIGFLLLLVQGTAVVIFIHNLAFTFDTANCITCGCCYVTWNFSCGLNLCGFD
jgi:hypothetical protein